MDSRTVFISSNVIDCPEWRGALWSRCDGEHRAEELFGSRCAGQNIWAAVKTTCSDSLQLICCPQTSVLIDWVEPCWRKWPRNEGHCSDDHETGGVQGARPRPLPLSLCPPPSPLTITVICVAFRGDTAETQLPVGRLQSVCKVRKKTHTVNVMVFACTAA